MSGMTRIYIGNLPFSLTEDQIRDKFSEFGAIEEVALIMDHHTGRPKGFGFVTYVSAESADAAIAKMNGQDFNGRNLRVNIAKPKDTSSGGGGRRSGGGHGGGGRRSYGHQSDSDFGRSEE